MTYVRNPSPMCRVGDHDLCQSISCDCAHHISADIDRLEVIDPAGRDPQIKFMSGVERRRVRLPDGRTGRLWAVRERDGEAVVDLDCEGCDVAPVDELETIEEGGQ